MPPLHPRTPVAVVTSGTFDPSCQGCMDDFSRFPAIRLQAQRCYLSALINTPDNNRKKSAFIRRKIDLEIIYSESIVANGAVSPGRRPQPLAARAARPLQGDAANRSPAAPIQNLGWGLQDPQHPPPLLPGDELRGPDPWKPRGALGSAATWEGAAAGMEPGSEPAASHQPKAQV